MMNEDDDKNKLSRHNIKPFDSTKGDIAFQRTMWVLGQLGEEEPQPELKYEDGFDDYPTARNPFENFNVPLPEVNVSSKGDAVEEVELQYMDTTKLDVAMKVKQIQHQVKKDTQNINGIPKVIR